MKVNFSRIHLMLLLVLAVAINACKKTDPETNIILIVADDLGYTDVSYLKQQLTNNKTNATSSTPNLDFLAQNGTTFTQAYANPEGVATRASILTGKFAASMGFICSTNKRDYTFHDEKRIPEVPYHIHDCYWREKVTVPQKLKNGLTQTALFSGHHSDKGQNEVTIAEALTNHHSAFIGKWHLGGHSAKDYQPSDQGFEVISSSDNQQINPLKFRRYWAGYPAKEKISNPLGPDNQAEHVVDFLTHQANDFIKSYSGEKPFFLMLNHFADNKNKEEYLRKLDQSIGNILNTLKETEQEKNTLLIFTSDNGSPQPNNELKGQKSMLYEGGIRVPLFFYQKGKIDKQNSCNIPVSCVDIFPTLLEKCEYPNEQTAIHGHSLLPLLYDTQNKKEKYIESPIYLHFPVNKALTDPDDHLPLTPSSAIREGNYKLIVDWTGNMKLYNIEEDPKEAKNLVVGNKELADSLNAHLCDWLRQNVEEKYYPQFNPYYDITKDKREYPYPNVLARLWFGEE